MYNTGDVGIWQANGTIQLLGRCDDQVKIKVHDSRLRKAMKTEKPKRGETGRGGKKNVMQLLTGFFS